MTVDTNLRIVIRRDDMCNVFRNDESNIPGNKLFRTIY
jgi:hypothetical protein